jgi:hypothetical protein
MNEKLTYDNIVPDLNEDDINMIVDKEIALQKKKQEFVEDDDFKVTDNEYESYMRKDQRLCKPDNKKWYDRFLKKDKYYNKVDRMQQLRNEMDPFIEHDTSVNIYTGKKVSDIYDELTKNNAKCYAKKCLKKPYIDPYSGQAYYFSNNTNQRTITDSQWEYENECTMNGGAFDGNIYGVDPADGNDNGTSLVI